MSLEAALEKPDEAFGLWWERLGSNMPRPDPKETDDEYRKRTARSAFLIASACFMGIIEAGKIGSN